MSAPAAPRARSRRLAHAAGVAAAVVIAVVVNLLSTRHYRRWDWTSEGLYTLGAVTRQTLASLGEPLKIYVLLGSADPLSLTLRHLLEAYRAESGRLEVRFVDPDRNPGELLALQKTLSLTAGRTEDGRVVADASVVLVRGKRRHFITSDELVSVEAGDEMRARPRVEQVLTAAIRQLIAGVAAKVCVTSGHGEASLDAGGDEGLLAMRGRLEKANYQVVSLPPLRKLEGKDPIADCRLVIVAGPQQPLPKAEVTRLSLYFEGGGNLLVAAGPVPDERSAGYVDLGLGPLLAAMGVRRHDDFVFELSAARRSSEGLGEIFIAEPREHPITGGLVAAEGAIPVLLTVASSLEALDGAHKPAPLLGTSPESFGMADFFSWAAKPTAPEPKAGDRRGPLVVAYAVELPKVRAADRHGPRAVVLGSNSPIYGGTWQSAPLAGTRLFIEGALSWLAAQTIVLDIPDKRGHAVGLKVTAEVLRGTFVKVVVLLPLFAVLAGVGVRLRRRATEVRGGAAPPKKRKPRRERPRESGDG